MFDQPQQTASNRTVDALCQFAGMERPDAGFTLRAVVELLSACEYVVSHDDLLRLVDRGRVILADGLWTDLSVHTALAHLEASRRWAPGSTLHRFKKSAAKLLIEETGDQQLRIDVADRPLRELLLLLTECDNRGMREALLESVLVKCSLLETVIDD